MTTLELLSPTLDFWDWREDGACKGYPELFYNGEDERKGIRRAKEREAKEVCAECPVLAQCREYALETGEPYGVWGGLTEMERHRILGRQRSG